MMTNDFDELKTEIDEMFGQMELEDELRRLMPSCVNRGSHIVVMPFGRYRGEPLERIDSGYLLWALKNIPNMHPELRQAIKTCLSKQKRRSV